MAWIVKNGADAWPVGSYALVLKLSGGDSEVAKVRISAGMRSLMQHFPGAHRLTLLNLDSGSFRSPPWGPYSIVPAALQSEMHEIEALALLLVGWRGNPQE